ncbi:MAG: hypothetical protein OXI51_14275 [Chloroflexota bacterium]|nr:hypothetical protein [Chloroflexota bacterium]
MRSSRKPLVGRDHLSAEIHEIFATHTRIMVGLMVAIAGVAITITEFI